MIEKATIAGEQGYMVNCDKCSHYEFFAFPEFIEMIQEAKRQGWRFRLNGDEWEHFCFECIKKFKEHK